MWWPFAQLYKNSTDCFVLEVSAVGIDFKMESAVLDYSRKSPSRGAENMLSLRKTPSIFRSVTLLL